MKDILNKRARISAFLPSLRSIWRKRSVATPNELSACIQNLRRGLDEVLAVREMEREIPQLRKERDGDFIRPVATVQSHMGAWEGVKKVPNTPFIKRGS